jgi:AAA15 family ATPase/GTPase
MIGKLSIKNFKSIKDLEIDCKRINLFIGEPNAGKSNILEALGVASWCSYGGELKKYVRFQGIQNLFYDDLLDHPVRIKIDRLSLKILFEKDNFNLISSSGDEKKTVCVLDYSGNIKGEMKKLEKLEFIKFYRFLKFDQFPDIGSSYLIPPHGANLFSVVMGSKKLRETMARFFKNFGFNPVFKPQEKTFEIQKQVGDLVFSYPYTLISDTLQTIIFHVISMESNKNSSLVFEEPEAHAFPYYTKYLGEKIAMDESNQYFIATHNPYLLRSIIEKAEKNSVGVFVTYFKDYQTQVKCLTRKQKSELMDYDPFFNLNSFIEEEE